MVCTTLPLIAKAIILACMWHSSLILLTCLHAGVRSSLDTFSELMNDQSTSHLLLSPLPPEPTSLSPTHSSSESPSISPPESTCLSPAHSPPESPSLSPAHSSSESPSLSPAHSSSKSPSLTPAHSPPNHCFSHPLTHLPNHHLSRPLTCPPNQSHHHQRSNHLLSHLFASHALIHSLIRNSLLLCTQVPTLHSVELYVQSCISVLQTSSLIQQ